MTTFVRLTLLFVFLAPVALFSQNGSISGKIIDAKTAETIIGVTVKLDPESATPRGAITDLDGYYKIGNVTPGKHKILINYLGYSDKQIEEIEVVANQATTVDIALEESKSTTIAEVVIVSKASRESQSALTILQKNSAVIADGVSSETIKRTPDRTTGDVIRRVSGASIQDNKFAVIRGLNDRYNIALLNGGLLSSTEPDRKAFSFDLFPAAMLDNLVVMKTASADLPGEFAGGAILLTTRDIPEESFLQANVSTGFNTVTTFKPYQTGQNGGQDWLGMDDGTRALPDGFPTATQYQNIPSSQVDEKYRVSKLLPNDWAIQQNSSAAPNTSLQLSGGYVSKAEKNVQFGSSFALSYNNNNRIQQATRNDFDVQGQAFEYMDNQFRNNVLWGGLFNTALKFNNRQKIGLQATYTTNTDDITNVRTGRNFFETRYENSSSIEYTENHLLTSRLFGEHQWGEKGIRVNWGAGFNQNNRDVPSLRRITYLKNFDDAEGDPFRAFIPFGSATLNNGGRFYSKLNENVVNGNFDISLPFILGKQKQIVKFGGLTQVKDRVFDARVMGYQRSRPSVPTALFTYAQDSIFAPGNIGPNGFVLSDITNESDKYDASSNLYAAYVLFDNKVTEKLRISWGVRYESFRQKLNSIDYSGAPVNVNRSTNNLLPSFNMTYSLTEKQQVRLSGSKTVTRPEFREIAPFAFYDFYLNAGVVGDPNITAGSIYNADVRYEIYPGANQLFSVSAFYKKFYNPIEFTFSSLGAGTRTFTYQNIAGANNYGVELELRKNLGFVGLENLLVFSNVAFIRSDLNLDNVSAYDKTRALQGQSPYIANAGVTYNLPNIGFSTTLVYNVVGDRVAQVGTDGYGDIYERHRNMLDFQVSKRFGKNLDVKLTWGDILRPDFIFYQDNDASHGLNDKDNIMQRLNAGSTITLAIGYRL
jgi:TonB-dependent receptor